MVSPAVLSLELFFLTLCPQPVSDKVRKHNLSYQKFADDTQLHKAYQPTEFQCLVSDFESCSLSVKAWMLSNKLKLNGEKRSHASRFTSDHKPNKSGVYPVRRKKCFVSLNSHVKNLGLFLNNTVNGTAY